MLRLRPMSGCPIGSIISEKRKVRIVEVVGKLILRQRDYSALFIFVVNKVHISNLHSDPVIYYDLLCVEL